MINDIFMKECRKLFNIKIYEYVPNIYDLIDCKPNESDEKELYDFVKGFQIKYPKCETKNTLLRINCIRGVSKRTVFFSRLDHLHNVGFRLHI